MPKISDLEDKKKEEGQIFTFAFFAIKTFLLPNH